MSDKVLLTLQDLHTLHAIAERNNKASFFAITALEWAGQAQAELERLRALDSVSLVVRQMRKIDELTEALKSIKERCAQLCEQQRRPQEYQYNNGCQDCAAAIRELAAKL